MVSNSKLSKPVRAIQNRVEALANKGFEVFVLVRYPSGAYVPVITKGFKALHRDGIFDAKTAEAVYHLESRKEEAVLLNSSRPPEFKDFPLSLWRAVVEKVVGALVPGRKHRYPFNPNGSGNNQHAVASTSEEVFRLFREGDTERGLEPHAFWPKEVAWPERGFSRMPARDLQLLWESIQREVRMI